MTGSADAYSRAEEAKKTYVSPITQREVNRPKLKMAPLASHGPKGHLLRYMHDVTITLDRPLRHAPTRHTYCLLLTSWGLGLGTLPQQPCTYTHVVYKWFPIYQYWYPKVEHTNTILQLG